MALKAKKNLVEKKPTIEKIEEKRVEKVSIEKKPKAQKHSAEEGNKASMTKKKAKRVETYTIYIFKVLNQVQPDIGISSKAMGIMNPFINDIFKKLAGESDKLARYNKNPTITCREIQTVGCRILLRDLAKHDVFEGTKAITNFTRS